MWPILAFKTAEDPLGTFMHNTWQAGFSEPAEPCHNFSVDWGLSVSSLPMSMSSHTVSEIVHVCGGADYFAAGLILLAT